MNKEVIEGLNKKGLPPLEQLQKLLVEPLTNSNDFAEIYVEEAMSKSYLLSERLISEVTNSYGCGAGIRVVRDERTGYSYTENLSLESIRRCITDASRIAGVSKNFSIPPAGGPWNLYDIPASFFEPTAPKIDLLKRAEAKAFAVSPLVEKVEVYFGETRKAILVINSLGRVAYDVQPMLRFTVSVILKKDNLRERGSDSGGGRFPFSWFQTNPPEIMAENAVKQALILLEARPAPAGEMEVVLGCGESGILLHESIGHPLEADFNLRGSSAFSGKIGQMVASDQCTIVDQGNLPNERGSVNIDDEGNTTERNVLIENGILRTYMFDLISGNHFKQSSYNGRRESFRDIPLPRMTNTFMLPGKYSFDEITGSVKKGIYAKTYSGGQVDITSGDFVFSITEGYLIENGKIGYPIKGASLIGNGPEILKRVVMVGNDLVISGGKWTCGKDGQSVPVGVGMPSVKLSHITVGGTQND